MMTQPLVTDATVRELPPSCKLVWLALDQNGAMTQKAIIDATGLSRRAVRTALARLDNLGLIEKRCYNQDARQSLYSLID